MDTEEKGVKIKRFQDAEELAERLSEHVAQRLKEAIAKRGHGVLVVSGGSTPLPLFEHLSSQDIPWEKVFITLADERWVEPDDADSNEHLVRNHLLKNRAARARFIGLKTDEASAGQGEMACEKRLREIPTPFDIVVLGMGGDGHTASLFPGASRLAAATAMDSGRRCMAITPATAPHERMTLTLPALLNSREIILHITGEKKWQVYEKAAAKGPEDQMPIRYILRQKQVPVTVWWAP